MALQLNTTSNGKPDYEAIARRGHDEKRIVQASFKDLIPVRHQANAGTLSLERPSEEEVAETRERTQQALAKLVSGAVSAQNPKNVKDNSRREPTFVRYTPTSQMGGPAKGERIMKIVDRQQDPMEPPKFKHKKIPRGPPSPPPPILRSPPRKLTAEDQQAWKIPPPISNWKNPKGYTVPLDKRLAADGRGLQDVTINDKFANFAEALYTADRHAREEVKQRAMMQQKLAEKEKAQKEEHLRQLAQQARADRAGGSRRRSRSASYDSSESDSDEEDMRAREEARRERRRENERELRQSRMGTERKIQMMAREQNRDISEKVALGLAKPSQSGEAMYDSRLFNQSSGFNTGFNEDNPYDKPLWAARDALDSIYRPSVNADDDEDGGETMERLNKQNRFDILGKPKEGFKGAADAEARSGPVQFEKDNGDDPFNINQMISEVAGGGASGSGQKRYGIEEPASARGSKRARVEDED
jgi:SNW domain-containing protein 1